MTPSLPDPAPTGHDASARGIAVGMIGAGPDVLDQTRARGVHPARAGDVLDTPAAGRRFEVFRRVHAIHAPAIHATAIAPWALRGGFARRRRVREQARGGTLHERTP